MMDGKSIFITVLVISVSYLIGEVLRLIFSSLMDFLEENERARFIVKCAAVIVLTILMWRLYPLIFEIVNK